MRSITVRLTIPVLLLLVVVNVLAPAIQAATPQLAAGFQHSLALHADGTVYAWGDNSRGQLGNGQAGKGLLSARPVRVQNLTDIVALAARANHNLALRADGTVWAWGQNDQGQLGDGSLVDRATPVQVSQLTGVAAIATGWKHSLAVRSDGTLWVWGANDGGRFGNGRDGWGEWSTVPIAVRSLSGVVATAAGYAQSFAIKSDGTLWAWGVNSDGQLGLGAFTDTETLPVQVVNVRAVTRIATQAGHVMAQTSDGQLWVWGSDNSSGQFGDGTTTASAFPVAVRRLPSSEPTTLALGWIHSIARLANGQVWTWGNNWYGQLGIGDADYQILPVQVTALAAADAIAAGENHSLAMISDGFVWSWGLGGQGQLGLGDDNLFSEYLPKQVLNTNGSDFLNLRQTPAAEAWLTVSVEGSGRVRDDRGTIDCPGVCQALFATDQEIRLSATPASGWTFAGWGGACTGSLDCLLTLDGSISVIANFSELSNRYQLDSPINGSFESGIGVVHGWVCEASQIGIQVDDRAPFAAAYGAERTDSQGTCGDTANGFAAAINWADYGDGAHTLTLFADGQPLTEARVIVTTLGESFLTGLSATTRVSDFPAGFSTPLAWSEPHQNFVVTHTAVSTHAGWMSRFTRNGHWESPLAGGVESGRALIRGWVCSASTVSATLDGELLNLPYGSEREDTLTVCGDTDNGYALAINWNDYDDGLHRLSLILDGATIETRDVHIATPGGQGTVSGVQQQHQVDDFPHPGDTLTLQWSEPHQNFRLIAYAPADQSARYNRKVRAYFHGGLGRAPTVSELDDWSAVLLDNSGSVWRPVGVGLQPYLSDLVGWGTTIPTPAEARTQVDTVLANLFGTTSDLDSRIPDYYVGQLISGSIRARGLVNALLNDLSLMPRVDGTYGQPNGWEGGPGDGLLTQVQIDAYRARVE